MKKSFIVLGILFCLTMFGIVFLVFRVSAETTISDATTCTGLEEHGDGTVTRTCTLKLNVSGGTIRYNVFNYTVTLNNMKVQSITPMENWYIKEEDGGGFSLETSLTSLSGEVSLGVVVFEKIEATENCNATYRLSYSFEDRSCTIFQGNYYDPSGEITSALNYRKYCEKPDREPCYGHRKRRSDHCRK